MHNIKVHDIGNYFNTMVFKAQSKDYILDTVKLIDIEAGKKLLIKAYEEKKIEARYTLYISLITGQIRVKVEAERETKGFNTKVPILSYEMKEEGRIGEFVLWIDEDLEALKNYLNDLYIN